MNNYIKYYLLSLQKLINLFFMTKISYSNPSKISTNFSLRYNKKY